MNMRFFKMITICMGSTIALVSCQSNQNEDVRDTSLTYQYTINGCDTGKKTFSDLSTYCATLINNEQNNYCAENERLLAYREKCSSDDKSRKSEIENHHPTDEPTKNFPESTRTEGGRADSPESSPSLNEKIQKLVLVAHPETPLSVESKVSGNVFLTTLSGTLVVDSIEPKFKKNINLMHAEVVTLINNNEQDKCPRPTVNLFWPLTNKPFLFSVYGTDQKDQMGNSGCMARLSAMSMAGLIVEFKNVPVGGVLSNEIIPSVTLKVEIRQDSQSDSTNEK